MLLSRGADPNLCGNNHRSSYRAALENGYRDLAAEIRLHGGGDNCRP
jgi:hypothetical protein